MNIELSTKNKTYSDFFILQTELDYNPQDFSKQGHCVDNRYKNIISRHDHQFLISFFEKNTKNGQYKKKPWDSNTVPCPLAVMVQ